MAGGGPKPPRLIVIAGKGGVGRTTIASALGLHLAQAGSRVLVAHCRCGRDLSDVYGSGPIDHRIRHIDGTLWAVNMQPREAILEMGLLILRVRALVRLVLDSRLLRALLEAVPALEAYSMLGKAWYHSCETQRDGSPRFDSVVFDGPATGHLIGMLRIPEVILSTVKQGPLVGDARRIRCDLRNPTLSHAWIVTIAEEMALKEAEELSRHLRGEFGIHVARVVINGLYPANAAPPPDVGDLLAQDRVRDATSALGHLAQSARILAERWEMNAHYLDLIHAAFSTQGIPRSKLPYLFPIQREQEIVSMLSTRLNVEDAQALP